MKKLAKNLTEKQKEVFIEAFMDVADSRLELISECDNWACPWDWRPEKVLTGKTVKEMAENFYKENERFIVEELDEDEEMRKEFE